MTSTILVTGGTGTLGQHVTPALRDAGAHVRILSRRPHEPEPGIDYVTGDLLADEGIGAAVEGMDVIVHLAGGPKGDEAATANLVRAAAKAAVRHLVFVSVIGADTVPLGYFRAKLGAEHAVAESGLAWTTLRAAQFHDLVFTVAQKMAKLPLIPVPRAVRAQPVDSREVAERLVALALGAPEGQVPDLAGPREYELGELVRGYLRARGTRRPMIPVRMPGKAGRVYRAGRNLSLDGVERGQRTWEDFLADRLSRCG